jgi:hypothetical protein
LFLHLKNSDWDSTKFTLRQFNKTFVNTFSTEAKVGLLVF